MRAIVVGAGIGGLTAALTLERAGIDARLFEQAPFLREVGAGIQISPNATRILHRLGLADPLQTYGVRPLATVFRRWEDGRVLARHALADECERVFGAPYYHFHRAELLDILAAAVPNGVLHLDHRCVDVAQYPDRVVATFHNGLTVEGDVLIGADGIHSEVRRAIFGPESPRFSGCIAYRGLVPAQRLAHLAVERSGFAWWGPDRHFVHYFVGRGARYMNFVAIAPADDWRTESWTTKGEVKDALTEYEGWHPQVREIIGSADTINKWALYDRDMMPRWTMGRVALIGDAAHAMLPFMAQGAVQSIEDAAVIARCLADGDSADVNAALRRYEEIRKPRATRCQAGSRSNKDFFHLHDGEAQLKRDADIAHASNLPSSQSAWLYGHDAEAEFAPRRHP